VELAVAIGVGAGVLNFFALVDLCLHRRREWLLSGRSRALAFWLSLAGFTCGVSTAPFLAAIPIYTGIFYWGVVHPPLKRAAAPR
jgi:hypothetical protein